MLDLQIWVRLLRKYMTKVEMNIYFFVRDQVIHLTPMLGYKKRPSGFEVRAQFFITFKNFDFNYSYKNEIEEYNEKIYSRISDTVCNKIDFTAYDIHRDYPPAWELNSKVNYKLINDLT